MPRGFGGLGPGNPLELVGLLLPGGAIADRLAAQQARAFLIARGCTASCSPQVPGSGAYTLILHLHASGSACRWPRAAAALAAAFGDAGG